jgi:WD40 repeat protein
LYIYELDSGSYFAAADHPPLFSTGSDDNTVRIWDVATKQQVAELKGHTNIVTSVAFDSSGKYLASGEVA